MGDLLYCRTILVWFLFEMIYQQINIFIDPTQGV